MKRYTNHKSVSVYSDNSDNNYSIHFLEQKEKTHHAVKVHGEVPLDFKVCLFARCSRFIVVLNCENIEDKIDENVHANGDGDRD